MCPSKVGVANYTTALQYIITITTCAKLNEAESGVVLLKLPRL